MTESEESLTLGIQLLNLLLGYVFFMTMTKDAWYTLFQEVVVGFTSLSECTVKYLLFYGLKIRGLFRT